MLPKRDGLNSDLPVSYKDAGKHWHGLLPGSQYPEVINPKHDRIWTANAGVVSKDALKKIGNGGYALEPGQRQIRNTLLNIKEFSERDLLNIALDDRAVYMENWRKIILNLDLSNKRHTLAC